MTAMHSLFDNARQMFGTAQLSWPASNPRMLLCNPNYVAVVSQRTLADVPIAGRVGDPLAVTGLVMDRGIAFASPMTIPPGYAGQNVNGLLLYTLGLDEPSSMLIAYYSQVLGLPGIVPPGGAVLQLDAINGLFKV